MPLKNSNFLIYILGGFTLFTPPVANLDEHYFYKK